MWSSPGRTTSSAPAIRSAYQSPLAAGAMKSASPYQSAGRGDDVARIHVPDGSPGEVVEDVAVRPGHDSAMLTAQSDRGRDPRPVAAEERVDAGLVVEPDQAAQAPLR